MKRAPFLSLSLDAIVSVSSVCLLLSCFRDAGSTLTTLSPLLSFFSLLHLTVNASLYREIGTEQYADCTTLLFHSLIY